MSKTLAIVNTSTDTFQTWVNKTNECINAISNEVITANATVGVTSGNAFVIGTFGASILAANGSIRGGNATVSNTLYVSSNISVNNNTLSISNSSSNSNIIGSTLTLANTTKSSIISLANISYGNSTINASLTSTNILIQNTTSNSSLDYSSLLFSNSTVSSKFSLVDLLFGNSTVNSVTNNSGHFVSNSTVNAAITLGYLHIGNSTINTTANSSMLESALLIGTSANIVSLFAETASINNATVNTSIALGANVIVNTSVLAIGNSTLNSIITSVNYITGNSTVSVTVNSTALTFSNTSGVYTINGDLVVNAFTSRFTFGSFSTSSIAPVLVDSFNKTSLRAAEYNFSASQSNGTHLFQKMVVQNYDHATDVNTIEYGVMTSNASANVGTFSANANTTHVTVYFTPLVAVTNGQFSRLNLGI
jgi:hypothetical protein